VVTHAEEAQPAEPAAPPRAPLQHPGRQNLGELLRLGRIGYVRGIEAKLNQLADDPAHHTLVEELRGHLRAFDLKRYTAVLEAMDADD